MIGSEQWMEIKDLHRQGVSQRRIAEITGHSRNTVARALLQRTPQPFGRTSRRSVLDPFKPYLTERYEAFGLSSVRLLEEVQAQGYTGSLNLVQRFVKTLRDERIGSAKKTVRFETAPGEQAQADWAEVGMLPNGQKVYAFLMVLGFSRMLYVAFTLSMALPSRCATTGRCRLLSSFRDVRRLPGSRRLCWRHRGTSAPLTTDEIRTARPRSSRPVALDRPLTGDYGKNGAAQACKAATTCPTIR